MSGTSQVERSELTRWSRILRFPLVRIAVAILAIAVPFAIVAAPFNMFVSDKSLKRVGAILLTAVVVAAYWGYVRIVEKRAVSEFSRRHAIGEVASGLGFGALLFSLTIGVLAALGAYQVTGNNGWPVMLATIPGFILFGVLEEVVVRGIIFRILEQSLGSWIGIAISAAVFGMLHLLNPGATVLNAAAVSVEAGILLAAAFMFTRRLWLCIGIHIAWNFTQGGVFSGAVSGGSTTGLLQARLVGPNWLTGGTFGVEASVVALAVCAGAGILLLIAAARKGNVVAPRWSSRHARSLVEARAAQ